MCVIVTLIAMSAAGVNTLKRKSRDTQCANNMRQLGMAAMLYVTDNNMCLPVSTHQRATGVASWTKTLQEYAGGEAMTVRKDGRPKVVFYCPADEIKRPYTYVINDFLMPNPDGAPDLDFSRLSRVETRTKTFLFAEAARTYANTDHFHLARYRGLTIPDSVFSNQVAVSRHSECANYVFLDGHMETLSWVRVQELLQSPNSSFVEPNR